MNNELIERPNLHVNADNAIYDNGDQNSRNNKYVAAINRDSNLTAEEKERLLKNHDQNVAHLASLIDADKRRQEQELDRMLKERLERRRKLLEKQHAPEIKKESEEAEERINGEYKQKTEDFIQENKAKQASMLQEALKEDDYTAQREQVLKVEGECAKEKKEGLEQIDEERVAKIEAEKKAIRDKFTIGAKDEEEIRQ